MNTKTSYDAVVVGSGPNGLSAAVHIARSGKSVKVYEASDTIGGGTRTKELTKTGFLHDVCSAVHPTAAGSPHFQTLPLEKFGLEWVQPAYPLAHPLENGEAIIAHRSLEMTAEQFGADKKAFIDLFDPFVSNWESISKDLFAPLRFPNHPFLMARFGWFGLHSANNLAGRFKTKKAKAYLAGHAAHSILPFNYLGTAAFGLVLGSSVHSVGWPVAKGGSHKITNALASYFKSLGGEIETGRRIKNLDELPSAKAVLLNIAPKQFIELAGDKMPGKYRKKLSKFTYGPGVFKLDYALSEPVPWTNPECKKAGSLHLGGTYQEIATSERAVWNNEHPEKPYVLIAQPTVFDPSRAPEGKHILWAYCHVPNGSTKDMTEIIENQIERFAPGFRNTIIAKTSMNTADFEKYNPNYVGGDINAGAQSVTQLFTRPVARLSPYTTPIDGVYLCSSSTPPGGGVHGMAGFHAASKALSKEFS